MPDRIPFSADRFHTLNDGKRLRYAVYELEKPAHSTILIAPGRREFIEKKYAELGTEFLKRGFRIIIFEWRGQGLSYRYLEGAQRQRDHIPNFNIHLNDLDSFYAAIVKPHQVGKLVVCGHSMGSHLILRWLTEHQKTGIDAAIVTAPMLALSNMPAHTIARGISWLESKLGHDAEYAVAQHDYDNQDCAFVGNPLTHDPERFAIMEKYFTKTPDMTVGGVTWGWLHAALESMHTVQHRHYFEALTLPVLAITGSKDHVTPPNEITAYIKRIPGVENIAIDGSKHDIMNELDTYRLEAWQHIDAFLKRVISG